MAKNEDNKPAAPVKYKLYNVEKTVEQWSRDQHCVVPIALIEDRLARGWDLRHAIETCRLPEEV